MGGERECTYFYNGACHKIGTTEVFVLFIAKGILGTRWRENSGNMNSVIKAPGSSFLCSSLNQMSSLVQSQLKVITSFSILFFCSGVFLCRPFPNQSQSTQSRILGSSLPPASSAVYWRCMKKWFHGRRATFYCNRIENRIGQNNFRNINAICLQNASSWLRVTNLLCERLGLLSLLCPACSRKEPAAKGKLGTASPPFLPKPQSRDLCSDR